jgi:hypothetical protein
MRDKVLWEILIGGDRILPDERVSNPAAAKLKARADNSVCEDRAFPSVLTPYLRYCLTGLYYIHNVGLLFLLCGSTVLERTLAASHTGGLVICLDIGWDSIEGVINP